jgi:hypothetical protein
MNVLDQLKEIVSTKQRAKVTFQNGAKLMVDTFTASAILSAYNMMSDQNKSKFERMVNKGPQNFMKIMDLSLSKGE